jgi:uncharacterized membrane protein YhaH (DUF805 family)
MVGVLEVALTILQFAAIGVSFAWLIQGAMILAAIAVCIGVCALMAKRQIEIKKFGAVEQPDQNRMA